ncbi:MAG: hypothetical protein WD740_09150 [Anaerolineales bacterium]
MKEATISELQKAIEGLHKAKAKYKEKIAVQETLPNGSSWEGDVFVFELVYDNKHDSATKEEIAEWRLPGPSATALKAAEDRGLKIRKALQTSHPQNVGPFHKPKLAYAWSTPKKKSTERKFYAILHAGPVKSAADAVKTAMAANERQK